MVGRAYLLNHQEESLSLLPSVFGKQDNVKIENGITLQGLFATKPPYRHSEVNRANFYYLVVEI